METILATALLGSVGLMVATAMGQTHAISRRVALRGEIEVAAQRAALFVATRLQQSGTDPAADLTLLEPVTGGFHRVDFRVNESIDPATGDITWSGVRTLGFAYAPGEASGGTAIVAHGVTVGRAGATPDGVDDDGDGLVDEGILFYKTSAGGSDVWLVLATDVLPVSRMWLVSDAAATTPDPAGDEVVLHVQTAHRAPEARSAAAFAVDPTQYVRGVVERHIAPRNLAP